MKNTIISILILSVLLGISLLYFFYPRRVHVEFINAFSVVKSVDQVHEIIFPEMENLQHVCNDSTDILYHTDIKNNLDQFDFEKYDYLFVIGKEAMEVRHSPYIKYFVDMESHYSGMPVLIVHKGSQQDKIFIYRLPKKPKYRHLCC